MKNRLYHSNVATTANMFKMDRDRMFLEEGNKRDAIWNIARIIAMDNSCNQYGFSALSLHDHADIVDG